VSDELERTALTTTQWRVWLWCVNDGDPRRIDLAVDNLLRVQSSAEQTQYDNPISKHRDIEIKAIDIKERERDVMEIKLESWEGGALSCSITA
jgi:hypothetical protein